jgi:hypothetical protein
VNTEEPRKEEKKRKIKKEREQREQRDTERKQTDILRLPTLHSQPENSEGSAQRHTRQPVGGHS